MNKTEIRARLEKSSLRGLVPIHFEIIGDEIEFTPCPKFWKRWQVDENWLRSIGVRTYAIPRYRKPKPSEWRARVLVKLLDTLTRNCEACGVLIDDRKRFCTPCWQKEVHDV